MDYLSILPPELLALILTHLPRTSSTALRLTSRHFSHSPILFTHTFSPLVKQWLSEKESHKLISSIASDLIHRPAVMWSPWALEEKMDEDVEIAMLLGDSGAESDIEKRGGKNGFLEICFRLLVGYEHPESSSKSELAVSSSSGSELDTDKEGKQPRETLTFKNFATRSGKEEYTDKRLRTGRSRFLLYRKMMREGEEGW